MLFQTDIPISQIKYNQIYHFKNQPFHGNQSYNKKPSVGSLMGLFLPHLYRKNISSMASSQPFPQKSRAAAVLDKPRFTGGLSKTLVKRILRFLGCKTFLNDLLVKHCKGMHPPTPFDTGKTCRVVGERTFGIPVLADSYSQKRMNEKNYLRNARLAKHVQGFKLHH